MNKQSIPEGFKPFGEDNSFNDAILPVYIKVTDKGPTIGMLVEKQHCNWSGFLHGGVMMTLMDIALSSAISFTLGKYTSTPTVSISFDFMAATKAGAWVYADIHSVKLTRTLGFASGMIVGPDGCVARASGCFKLPNDLESAPGMKVEEYLQWRTQHSS